MYFFNFMLKSSYKEGETMKTIFPDYNNCLTSLSNSILKKYGLNTYHNTLQEVDELLKNDYKNIIILLYDGMGSRILDKTLEKDSFLIKNKLCDITSVFPATTAAATTSLLSGLNPYEHGYLGWDVYFDDIDKTITVFRNTIKDTKEPIDIDIKEKLKYKSIIELINNETEYSAYSLFPFGLGAYENLDMLYKQIINLSKLDGKKFIYAYVDEPDYSLHEYGVSDIKIKELINKFNKDVENLSNNLEDTLLIITADHGHVESNPVYLEDYPDIFNLLDRTTSIDSRATAYKIKSNKKDEFETLFNKHFGNDFKLYTKEEVIKNKFFGDGNKNKYFDSAIGDYLSIGIGNKYIKYNSYKEKDPIFKSHHAGITEDEVLIPLITISKKENIEDGIIREIEFKDYKQVKKIADSIIRLRYTKRKDVFQIGASYSQNDFYNLSKKIDDRLCVVYEVNKEILGMMELRITCTSGNIRYNYMSSLIIENIAVKEEYRRQKIATKLYEYAVKYAKKRRVFNIKIKCYEFNTDMKKFIKSLSMKPYETEYEYKL